MLSLRNCSRLLVFSVLAVFLSVGQAQAFRGEGVSRDDLPEALRHLDVANRHLPADGFKEAAVLHALFGEVVVVHRASGEAYFGREGDVLYENDLLETLEGARCRIRFMNEDVVTLASGTRFGIDEYTHDRDEGETTSFLSMVKGKAMFYAMRLFGFKKRRFTLKTPTAVAGVRGTKFGAEVLWVEDKTARSRGVLVADLGNQGLLTAQAEPRGTSFTNVFSEDGIVDVNGQTVAPGTMYQGTTGNVMPTPPQVIRSFEAETFVPEDGEDGGDVPPPLAEPSDTEEGETNLLTALTGPGDNETTQEILDTLTETVSIETGTETEESQTQPGSDEPEGKTAGMASGIAALIVDGSGWPVTGMDKGPFYNWGPNLFGEGVITHVAYEDNHEGNPSYILKLEEAPDGSSAKVTDFDWGESVPTVNTQFTYFKGGSFEDGQGNTFLEWGWWEDTSGSGKVGSGEGSFYVATKKIWHVEGLLTDQEYISYLQRQNAVYAYSGEGKGVMVDTCAPGNYHLSGPFSMEINFGTGSISDWHLNLSDGSGHSLSLHSSSGVLHSNGEFDIDNVSGTFNGSTATDPSYTSAGGAVVGPRAEGVAGTYTAGDGGDYWATGEFHGKRTESPGGH